MDDIRKQYPSNSHNSEDKKEDKKLEKMITGKAVRRKKTLGKKMAETFLGDDTKSVAQYIIYDVLIPAAKDTKSSMVSGGIEMLLFGETRGRNTRRDKGKSYVSYGEYYKNRDNDRRDRPRSARARHNFDDIVLDSRGEAEDVLSRLVDLVEEYGMASVGDLYELVGLDSNFTDDKYGWTNLGSACVDRVRDGYLLRLPRTVLLD